MATIKFFKSSNRPASLEGAIWFNPTTRTINVCKSTANNSDADWEPYAGKLVDAGWNEAKNTFTIQKSDGSEVVLNFSDVAASSAVTAALNALKAELEGKINTTNGNVSKNAEDIAANAEAIAANTQAIATEKSRAEGAEAGLQSQITAMDAAYKQVDTALGTRISTLEGQITGLSGTLHFRDDLSGAGKLAPTTSTVGAVGDFMVAGDGSEYICVKVSGSTYTWEKIGDTSAESAAIAELQTNVGKNTQAIADEKARAEGVEAGLDERLTTAESTLDTINSTYAKATDVNSSVQTLQQQITTNKTNIESNDQDIADLKAADEAFTGQINGINTTIGTLATKETVNGIDSRVSAVETQSAQNKTAIATLNGSATTAGSVAKAVADAKSELQDNIDAVDGKANKNAEDITALQSRAATIEGAATALTGRVTTAEIEIDDLQEAVESLQGVQGDYVQTTDYNAKMQALDAKDNSLQTAINTLNGANNVAGSVAKSVKDAIDALDNTVGSTTVAEGKHVAVQVVEENGLLTSVTVTEKDIASAAALSAVDTRLQAVEAKMPLLEWGTFEN